MDVQDKTTRPEQAEIPHELIGAEAADQLLARTVTRNHLAVFALALSVAHIEIAAQQQGEALVAHTIEEEHQAKIPFPNGNHWQSLAGSIVTNSGFDMHSRIEFGARHSSNPRVFPPAFDVPLLGEEGSKTIVSSSIKISRPSPVIPTTESILGITAIHTANSSFSQPEFEILNEVAGPRAFKPLIVTLTETSQETTDYSQIDEALAASNRLSTPNPIRSAHYATPDSLGVPQHILDRAKRIFTTLAPRIGPLACS